MSTLPIHTLTVNFHGICVNFRNIAPDVPHRVVLPNAMAVRFGIVHARSQPEGTLPTYYYLMPHFAFLRVEHTSDIAGSQKGTGLFGQHLRVLNASPGQSIQYPPDCQSKSSLSSFVPATPAYSESVVLDGHAACYFDFQVGTVCTKTTEAGREFTSIVIETDGPPRIAMTRLPPAAALGGPGTDELTVDSDTLTVGNVDFDSTDEDTRFDYLLNYLVTRDGIPTLLTDTVPGMKQDPQPLSADRLARALSGLAIRIASGQVDKINGLGNPLTNPFGALITNDDIQNVNLFVITASCSNSNWP